MMTPMTNPRTPSAGTPATIPPAAASFPDPRLRRERPRSPAWSGLVTCVTGALLVAATPACRSEADPAEGSAGEGARPAAADRGGPAAGGPDSDAAVRQTAPPAAGDAREAAPSPRHGEYVMYATAMGDSVRAFLVYPERAEAAPGLVVIHEIFGLTDWIRSVADRYAAEGFVAIAPDLLWGRGPGGGGTDAFTDRDAVIAAIRELPPAEVTERLDGARAFLRSLPAASGRVGVVGFCWGGQKAFQYAAEQPELDAAVVFYGGGPEPLDRAAEIEAPVLGLYGGEDARVNASIPAVERATAAAGRRYEKEIYPGAGHGFLREDEEGANAQAAAAAWPRSVEFLRGALEAPAALGSSQGEVPAGGPAHLAEAR